MFQSSWNTALEEEVGPNRRLTTTSEMTTAVCAAFQLGWSMYALHTKECTKQKGAVETLKN
jgi:hypothetical protein